MRAISLIALVLFSGGCGESATEVARELATGLRETYRVQVSVKASAEDPTPEDLALRKRIEDAIEQQNIGRLVAASGGSGQIEVVVEVENTAEAIPKLQEIVKELGVERAASYKVVPKE